MQVEKKIINPFETEFLISVDWIDVADDYNEFVKKRCHYPVKGFRAGKAPKGLIETTFSDEIKNELGRTTLNRFCFQIIKDEEIELANSPLISDIVMVRNSDVRFKLSVMIMPKFELPDYRNLNLEATDPDERIDEVTEKLLQQTDFQVPDSLIDSELDYSVLENDQPSEEEKELAEKRIRLQIILKKIANLEGIEVSEIEIKERVEELAQEENIPLEAMLEELKEGNTINRIADLLLAEQVLEMILEMNPE